MKDYPRCAGHVSADLVPGQKAEICVLAANSKNLDGSPMSMTDWLRVTLTAAVTRRAIFRMDFIERFIQPDGSLADTPYPYDNTNAV